MVKNLRYVGLANHFVAGQNKSEFEVGAALLHLSEDVLNQIQLIEKRDRFVAVLVDLGPSQSSIVGLFEKTSGRVSELDDENVLLDARFNLSAQQAFKEGLVLGKAADSRELVLKEAPDIVRFKSGLLIMGQQDLLSELIIVGIAVTTFEELSHLLALDEAVFLHCGIHEHLEQTLSLVVVCLWLVGEFNVSVNMGCRCRMHMVKATLRHVTQH